MGLFSGSLILFLLVSTFFSLFLFLKLLISSLPAARALSDDALCG